MQRFSAYLRTSVICTALGACAPLGAGWTEAQSPKAVEVQVVSENYVVKLSSKGRSLPVGERQELSNFLRSLGDLQDIEFSVRRTHKGLPLASLKPVKHELIAHGADERKIHDLAEIGFDYVGHWADVEIIAKRHIALAPACPDWSRSEISDYLNEGSSNFGCATASALALSVSDPRDLTRGRALQDASGVHTGAAIERYNTDQVREFPENSTSDVGQ